METLHNAPFSTGQTLCALLLAPLAGLGLILFLPVVGFVLTGKALLEMSREALFLRRKLRVIDA